MECKDFNLLTLRKVKALILCLQAFSAKSGKAGDILTCFHTLTCWLVQIFFFSQTLVGFFSIFKFWNWTWFKICPCISLCSVLNGLKWALLMGSCLHIFSHHFSFICPVLSFPSTFQIPAPKYHHFLNFSHMCLRDSWKFALNLAPGLSSNEHFSKSLFLQNSLSPSFIVLLIACQKTKNSLLLSIF